MLFSSLFAAALATALPLTLAQVIPDIPDICENPQVVSTGTAGENGDVLVEYLHCANTIQERSPSRLFQRQAIVDVCDAPCATNCFTGQVGTGPNPNDCAVIAGALLYDSQNIGELFVTNPANGTGLFLLQYQSCQTFFVNQATPTQALEYCRNDFSTLVNFIATNCQAQQNAHGGNCIANDQRWFVQVQHS